MIDSRAAGRFGSAIGPRVLVVEDDYFIGTDLEYYLTEAGFAVVGVAASAEEAVAMAERESPQLAIMDIRLAGARDGIETAMDLADRLGIRSIFVTAHGDPQTRLRAAGAKPLAWLQKPYAPDTLIALIRNTLAEAV